MTIEAEIGKLEQEGMEFVLKPENKGAPCRVFSYQQWESFKKSILADRQRLEDENKELQETIKNLDKAGGCVISNQNMFLKSEKAKLAEKDKEIEMLKNENKKLNNAGERIFACKEFHRKKAEEMKAKTLTAEDLEFHIREAFAGHVSRNFWKNWNVIKPIVLEALAKEDG